MEAYAAMDAEMDIEKARIAREAEALAAQGRGHMQGSRGPLAGIANRILRVWGQLAAGQVTLFVATRTLDVQLESWLDYAARVFM